MNHFHWKRSEARKGWLYVGKLVFIACSVLLCLAVLKYYTENLLAPKNFGLGGALAHPNTELLLIGSSHTRKSYDMRELGKEVGVASSFQISYDGTDLNTIAQTLDYLLSLPGHAPRYLVVEAYSSMLARKPDIQDPRFFFDAPPPLKRVILHSYLAQHRGAASLADIFTLIVNRGSDEILSHPFYAPIAERESYLGGRKDFYFPGLSSKQFRKLKLDVDTSTPNRVQLAALYHIIAITRSHHIATIYIDPPMPQPVVDTPHIQALKEEFGTILRSQHCIYIDGDIGFPINDPSMFSDSNHLSSQGRDTFTPIAAAKIKSWIASLPATQR